MHQPRPLPAGFTLLEVLIVVCLMVVLAGLVLPNSDSALHDQLNSTAQVLAGDLAYGRGLAVMDNSSYRFTFDLTANKYTLQHSGASSALNNLPSSLFSGPQDTPTSHVVALDSLPRLGPPARLAAVGTLGSSPQPVSDVEFGPLGGTTRTAPTVVWLCAGSGAAKRYISVSINPVTGLASVGVYSGEGPPSRIIAAAPVPSPML